VFRGLNCLYCSQGLDGADMVAGDPPEGVLVIIGITQCYGPIVGCLCSGPMTRPGSCGDCLLGVVGFDSAALR
jgi:hypothetical protein